jgi:hypothetical protein
VRYIAKQFESIFLAEARCDRESKTPTEQVASKH